MLLRLWMSLAGQGPGAGTGMARGRWIVVLATFDAAATDIGIRMQLIEEANPFAKFLYDTHVALFYASKIVLPLVLIAILPYIRQRTFIHRMIDLTFLIYALLALYHVGWMVYAVAIVK